MEAKTANSVAHVTLGKGSETTKKSIPAGPTLVPSLKAELGVDAANVLYLRHGNEKRVLGEDETVDVENGMHFEAVEGGGVSS